MPRTAIYTRAQIAKKTLHLIKERGPAAFTARDVGAALGTSSRPIFTAFENMDDLRQEVARLGGRVYNNFMKVEDGKVLSYTEYCLKLVRFCQKEPNLAAFALENVGKDMPTYVDPISDKTIVLIKEKLGLDDKQFKFLFRQCWAMVVGIATQCARAKVEYTDEEILEMFRNHIVGILYTFGHPDPKSAIDLFE